MELLRALAARFGRLTAEEIVDAYTGGTLLNTDSELDGKIFTCGTNPHVVAKLIDSVD